MSASTARYANPPWHTVQIASMVHRGKDLERGNLYVITTFPTPESVVGYQKKT